MRIVPFFRWHARKAGGLAVGLRVNFPSGALLDTGEHAFLVTGSASLIFFTTGVYVFYGITPPAS
jgi:hypothetical protein